MTDLATPTPYGALIEPATLKIERLLPGPIERVWAYLTESDLRRRWLASGIMEGEAGTSFEFVWRNDELTDPPGERPEGAADEHRMTCRIVVFEPPCRLVITWGAKGDGEVTFTLDPRGKGVLLTLVHRRVPDRTVLINVSAGWHAHLDLLVAHARGEPTTPFWNSWTRLRAEYDRRMPA